VTARILCISYSNIRSDSRVLRQLEVLARHGRVTTVGYGAAPDAAHEHLEIPRSLPSLPQTPSGVAKLAVRAYRSVALEAPAVRATLDLLAAREFDVVVANEARALPVAFAIAGYAKVWCDLHEWAPEERTHVLSWRLLVSPFMRWVCAEYLPRVDAATTINRSIAELYESEFGVRPEIVRNSVAFRPELEPSPPAEGIRLVHSGGAVPGRNIEALIEAVDRLGDPWSLDLYLIPAREADTYWKGLLERIDASPRTRLHPPVPPADLPRVLNAYDIGTFLLPPHTPNHRMMLPNKFFDFVQARLGLAFSPSVETDRLIRRYGLGVVTKGFGADGLVEALRDLTNADVASFKEAAHRVARELSSESDTAVQDALITRLIGGRRIRGVGGGDTE
jgi:hypothetical protein